MISKIVEIDDWDLLLLEEEEKEDPLDFDFTRRLVGQGRQTNLKELDDVLFPNEIFDRTKRASGSIWVGLLFFHTNLSAASKKSSR